MTGLFIETETGFLQLSATFSGFLRVLKTFRRLRQRRQRPAAKLCKTGTQNVKVVFKELRLGVPVSPLPP